MSSADVVDLVHLADEDGDFCLVRATGRHQPGVLTGHDVLRAGVLAHADFIDVRLEDLYLTGQDLDAWQQDISSLAPGRGAAIGGDRGPSLGVHMHEDYSLAVTINDPDRLYAVLGIYPQENWMGEHVGRLEQVRRTWPSEVVETSPHTYEWRPTQ